MRRMLMLLLMIVGLGFPLLLTSPASLAAPPVHEPLASAAAQTVIDLRSPAMPDLSSADLPQVSAGGDRTCVINRAGQLSCWGFSFAVPDDLGSVFQVRVAFGHTCAVTTAGALHCWGDNSFGQAEVPANLGAVSQVSAGTSHTCA
ncbi:MAG: hypothetical protein EOM24_28570, partial [Chloroflexia bacterium]|nr:hypothetical protein [Chloroflexia bacterium]